MAKTFSRPVLAELAERDYIGIRAGRAPHRFTHIWFVLVDNRVFVRAYYLRPRSWHRTFLEDATGLLRMGDREIPIRAVVTRSERLKDRIEAAYAEKYSTPSSRKYVRGFKAASRRATTTELVPR